MWRREYRQSLNDAVGRRTCGSILSHRARWIIEILGKRSQRCKAVRKADITREYFCQYGLLGRTDDTPARVGLDFRLELDGVGIEYAHDLAVLKVLPSAEYFLYSPIRR